MISTSVTKLQTLAIAAAKSGDWQKAIELNTEILTQSPEEVTALNRLGLAHLQLGDIKAAKENFQQALNLDKHNTIAQKHLDRIKSNQKPTPPAFTRTHFIEEPGKTKIAELHRLAGKQILDTLAVGQPCVLVLKNRYISVDTEDGEYIGALPEDISFRLTKLINTDNTYHCSIHSCSNNQCTVFLKEVSRSKQNSDIHSFPPTKANANSVDIDDRFLLEDFEDENGLLDGEEEETEELDRTARPARRTEFDE